jgi:TonB family protein
MSSLFTQPGFPEKRPPEDNSPEERASEGPLFTHQGRQQGDPLFPGSRVSLPDSSSDYHPLLLAQLQDDLARSRKRESFWISVVVHIVVILAVFLGPKYLPTGTPIRVATAEDLLHNKELTYLEAPPDRQKPPVTPPDTKFMSDKNRIATSRTPSIDRKTLDELRDSRRPGPPAPPTGPPIQQQQAQQQTQQPAQQQAQQQAPPGTMIAPQSQSPLTARAGNPFGGSLSAGSAIAEAARNSARSGYGSSTPSGDYGLGRTPSGGKIKSDMDVLSDTMGVDFGPYLSRVVQAVRMNWYTLIPEAAQPPLLKKGKVSIEFAILKDGRVAGMRIADGSGDVSLDRAAWGGITASNPFAPLPGEFRGPYLALRFHFYYNPDKKDMQ